VVKALQVLEEKDYLAKDIEDAYYVVDPLIKSSLVLFYPEEAS
jgi:hypothetical protein